MNTFSVSSLWPKTTILANFDNFGRSCTNPLLPMRVKFGVLEQTQGLRLPAEFRLDRFILSSCGDEKPQSLRFFVVFWTSAFSDVANWQQSDKVEHGAQLQTFPYPMASKSFLYSNTFMAKSGAQTLTFKSVTNKQTNRQTDRQTDKKLDVFGHPGGG